MSKYDFRICHDVANHFRHLFKQTDLSYFEHARVFLNKKAFLINTRDDYLRHFFEKKYSRPSPDIYEKSGIFLWAGIPDLYTYDGQMLDKKLNFNIDHGVSFINVEKDYIDICGFGTTPNASHRINYYLNHQERLKQSINDYLEHFNSAIKHVEKLTDHYPIPLRPKNITQKVNDDKITIIDSLTQRELECLHLLKKGHSAKSIANQLNISHRTVERHIENIRHKFHVHNRAGILQKI